MAQADAQSLRKSKPVLGVSMTVRLDAEDAHHFAPLYEIAERAGSALWIGSMSSEVNRINSLRTLEASQEFLGFLAKSRQLIDMTGGGTFSIFKNEKEEWVHENQKPLLAIEDKKVKLLRGSVSLNFVKILEGFVLDDLKAYLKGNSVKSAQISLGGSTLCYGKCRVQLQNPFDKRTAHWLELFVEDGSGSEFGVSQRQFDKKSKTQEFYQTVIAFGKTDIVKLSALASSVILTAPGKREQLLNVFDGIGLVYVHFDGSIEMNAQAVQAVDQLEIRTRNLKWASNLNKAKDGF